MPRSASGSPSVAISQSQSRVALRRDALSEAVVDLLDQRHLTARHRSERAQPGAELARDEVLTFAQIGESGGIEVDVVDRRQRDDHVVAQLGSVVRGDDLRVGGRPHDVTVDELCDVEVGAVDVVVGAQPHHGWHGNRRAAEAREQAVFANHVVSTGEDVSERRPA